MNYDFAAIEKKWQANWEKTKPYAAITGDKRPKFYGLIEFPYPSGQGLHVGHPRPFTAMDIVTRKKRMQGYNVLFPIGFDAFGLPTENYAIKNHIHPAIVTKNNIENFTKQLKMLGYGFDWDRCVDTTDPKYYKWTQWIFLQMFKHGLAYKSTMPVNWCTSCKCVLANEEVVNGVCERCGSEVIRKEKSQWMLKITQYAQRLIDDLDDVDYIERVKIQQRNWIGRSTGAEITFQTSVGDEVTVYTTRADTLFGTTYMVISPEHPLLKKWQPLIKNWDAVAAYQDEAAHKSDFERGELNKEKTGVRLEGIEVMNPVTHKPLPMFVSDYVLMGYGTGIVMGVPGHDQRDWEFAKKFGLPIIDEDGYELIYRNRPYDQEKSSIAFSANQEPDVEQHRRQRMIIFIILLIVPAINLSSMTQSRLRQRVAEIGVRRAFGSTKMELMGQIISENLVVTLLAGALGLLLSVAFAYLGNSLLFAQEFSQTLSPPAVDAGILLHASTFGWALLFCFVLNLLSSGFPAWRASRVGIVNALGGRLH